MSVQHFEPWVRQFINKRERERERKREMCVRAHTHTHTHTQRNRALYYLPVHQQYNNKYSSHKG